MALIDDAPTRPCCVGGAGGEPGLIDGDSYACLIDGCDWWLNECWWWWWWLIDNVTLIDGALGFCGLDIPKVTMGNHLFRVGDGGEKNPFFLSSLQELVYSMASTHEDIFLGAETGIFQEWPARGRAARSRNLSRGVTKATTWGLHAKEALQPNKNNRKHPQRERDTHPKTRAMPAFQSVS